MLANTMDRATKSELLKTVESQQHKIAKYEGKLRGKTVCDLRTYSADLRLSCCFLYHMGDDFLIIGPVQSHQLNHVRNAARSDTIELLSFLPDVLCCVFQIW